MASLDEKVHSKWAAGLADQRVSPAILALKMLNENKAVNEAALGYMINYIILMSERTTVPFQLVDIQNICKSLKISLEELGLTGKVQKETVVRNEFLSV